MFALELWLYCIKNSVSNSYTACNYPLSDRKLQRCCYNNIIYYIILYYIMCLPPRICVRQVRRFSARVFNIMYVMPK